MKKIWMAHQSAPCNLNGIVKNPVPFAWLSYDLDGVQTEKSHDCCSRTKHLIIWAASRKKGPYGNFDQNAYFSISWMCIIWRLICEILSGIAVQIRFLWDFKYGVYGAASFIAIVTSWYLRKDMRKFTSVILYVNIRCIAQWLREANFKILFCSGAFTRRHTHRKPECYFMQTRVDYFYRENMTSFLNYVTTTLRTLYAWRGSYIKLWDTESDVNYFIYNTKLGFLQSTFLMSWKRVRPFMFCYIDMKRRLIVSNHIGPVGSKD